MFEALDVPAARTGAVALADGKDLFWYGARLARSLDRLRRRVDDLAAGRSGRPGVHGA
jgi:hypothetical protein